MRSRPWWSGGLERSAAAPALDDAVSSGCRKSLAPGPPPITQRGHVVPLPDAPSAPGPSRLAQLLTQGGHLLLPMLDLIENAQAAVDDVVDGTVRPAIEAALLMSATQFAGPRQQGKKTDRDNA